MSAAVTIVVNGSIVASVAPAHVAAGRVVAPLLPIIVRLATRFAYEPPAPTVTIVRGIRRVTVRLAFVVNGTPYVELAPVVRALGGSAAFDARTKTLTIVLITSDPIVTPEPFDFTRPQVAPTAVFAPTPTPAAPRAAETGVPHPRRTAIPAAPSQPVPPSPERL